MTVQLEIVQYIALIVHKLLNIYNNNNVLILSIVTMLQLIKIIQLIILVNV